MSKDNSPPTAIPSPTRRASFSPGQKFSELFGISPPNHGGGPSVYPSPITTAAANAQAQQRRRMSITSLGLSGSPTQASAFAGLRARQDSASSGTSPSASIDEVAIEDGDAALSESPSSPFARRMSFGARALRDVKAGPGNSNGIVSTHCSEPFVCLKVEVYYKPGLQEDWISNTIADYSLLCLGEGFNWSEQIRTRAERSSSITAAPALPAPREPPRASVPVPELPVKELPKKSRVPDPFQERILKGDFYMD